MVGEQAEQAAGHVAHVPGRGALKDRRRWVPGAEHDLCRSDPGRQADDRHHQEPGDAGPAIGLAAPDGRDDGRPNTPAGSASRAWSQGSAASPTPVVASVPERHRRVAMQACEQPQRGGHRRRRGAVGIDRRRVQPVRRRQDQGGPAEPRGGPASRRRCQAASHSSADAPAMTSDQRRGGAGHAEHGESRRDQHRHPDAVKRVLLAPRARVGVARLEAAGIEVGVVAVVVVVAQIEVAVGDEAARDGQVVRRVAGQGVGRERDSDAAEPDGRRDPRCDRVTVRFEYRDARWPASPQDSCDGAASRPAAHRRRRRSMRRRTTARPPVPGWRPAARRRPRRRDHAAPARTIAAIPAASAVGRHDQRRGTPARCRAPRPPPRWRPTP